MGRWFLLLAFILVTAASVRNVGQRAALAPVGATQPALAGETALPVRIADAYYPRNAYGRMDPAAHFSLTESGRADSYAAQFLRAGGRLAIQRGSREGWGPLEEETAGFRGDGVFADDTTDMNDPLVAPGLQPR